MDLLVSLIFFWFFWDGSVKAFIWLDTKQARQFKTLKEEAELYEYVSVVTCLQAASQEVSNLRFLD